MRSTRGEREWKITQTVLPRREVKFLGEWMACCKTNSNNPHCKFHNNIWKKHVYHTSVHAYGLTHHTKTLPQSMVGDSLNVHYMWRPCVETFGYSPAKRNPLSQQFTIPWQFLQPFLRRFMSTKRQGNEAKSHMHQVLNIHVYTRCSRTIVAASYSMKDSINGMWQSKRALRVKVWKWHVETVIGTVETVVETVVETATDL